MAESSRFWDTSGVGDGADTYAASAVRELLRACFTTDHYTTQAVLGGVANSLAVTAVGALVSVATGAALVNGIYYQNTAVGSSTIPTPSNGTTGYRVALSADWSTQTVRIVLVSNGDGYPSPPNLSVTENGRWDVSLASFTIDTSGTIVLTDTREYCSFATALIHARRGGSSSAWNTQGSNIYTPGGTLEQCGVATLTWNSDHDSDVLTVQFPQAFKQNPIVFLTPISAGVTQARTLLATVESIGAASFKIHGERTDGSSNLSMSAGVLWRAVGQE